MIMSVFTYKHNRVYVYAYLLKDKIKRRKYTQKAKLVKV